MDKSKDKVNLSIINDARIISLGIATFLVTFFHTSKLNYVELINVPTISNIINFIQKIGNCGVDIFLFLSGVGLFMSLSKNRATTFYKNRFLRILPKYIIILIVYSFFVKKMTWLMIIERIFGIHFFVYGIRDSWYISFIMVLYLVFPLIYKLFKKYDIFALFFGIVFVMLFNGLLSCFVPEVYWKLEIALTRIPVFICGIFVGKKIYDGTKISRGSIKYSIIIQLFIIFLFYFRMDLIYSGVFARYMYCPLAICSVINISWLYSLIKNKNNLWLKPLKFLGFHSLEMYLIFERCSYILRYVYLMDSYVNVYIFSFIITIISSYVLNKLVIFMIDKLSFGIKKNG